jgi:hypothetical protein
MLDLLAKHDGEEIAVRARKDTSPITRLHDRGKGSDPGPTPKVSSMS